MSSRSWRNYAARVGTMFGTFGMCPKGSTDQNLRLNFTAFRENPISMLITVRHPQVGRREGGDGRGVRQARLAEEGTDGSSEEAETPRPTSDAVAVRRLGHRRECGLIVAFQDRTAGRRLTDVAESPFRR